MGNIPINTVQGEKDSYQIGQGIINDSADRIIGRNPDGEDDVGQLPPATLPPGAVPFNLAPPKKTLSPPPRHTPSVPPPIDSSLPVVSPTPAPTPPVFNPTGRVPLNDRSGSRNPNIPDQHRGEIHDPDYLDPNYLDPNDPDEWAGEIRALRNEILDDQLRIRNFKIKQNLTSDQSRKDDIQKSIDNVQGSIDLKNRQITHLRLPPPATPATPATPAPPAPRLPPPIDPSLPGIPHQQPEPTHTKRDFRPVEPANNVIIDNDVSAPLFNVLQLRPTLGGDQVFERKDLETKSESEIDQFNLLVLDEMRSKNPRQNKQNMIFTRYDQLDVANRFSFNFNHSVKRPTVKYSKKKIPLPVRENIPVLDCKQYRLNMFSPVQYQLKVVAS
jgi:hypothetical protein